MTEHCLPMPTVLLKAMLFASVFGVGYFLFHQQAFVPQTGMRCANSNLLLYETDLPTYIRQVRVFSMGNIPKPHPGFAVVGYCVQRIMGVQSETACALVLAGLITMMTWLQYCVLKTYTDGMFAEHVYLALAVVMMTVTAIYVPWINPNVFLGQGSPNVWHNPSYMLLKPFAYMTVILCLWLTVRAWDATSFGYTVLASLLLAATLLMKPSFGIVFLPALAVYILIWHRYRLGMHGIIVAALVPTIVVLFYQYRITYTTESSDSICLTWFGVWRLYSRNICVSTLSVIAFPLGILLCRGKAVLANKALVFSWFMTVVGMAQLAFLAEVKRFNDGNFGWGFLLSLSLLFTFSMVELLRWMAVTDTNSRARRAAQSIVCSLLALHFVSGVYYFSLIITGRPFAG